MEKLKQGSEERSSVTCGQWSQKERQGTEFPKFDKGRLHDKKGAYRYTNGGSVVTLEST